MKIFDKSSRGRSQGVPKLFRALTYVAHSTVIFAIAELSCYVTTSIIIRLSRHADRIW